MNIQNNLNMVKTIEDLSRLVGRKNFFSKIIKGFAGLLLAGSLPFKLFSRNVSSNRIEVKINPLAVSRDKENKKNG